MRVIEVQNLSKTFRTYQKEEGIRGSFKNLFYRKYLDNPAVDNISFELEEGEVVGFLGPNGAGKTTTLKMLTGLIYPTSGKAQVLGYTPWERKNDFRRQYSLIMGQKNQLWWDLPAIESFSLNKEIYQIPESQYRITLDELVELLEVQKLVQIQVRRLSLGERMKMELIAALLHQPRVLFLDEPTIGLDIISQKTIREFLSNYNIKHGTTILLTSHYMEDIQALCKRVIIINHGHKVYDGELQQIIREFSAMKQLTVTFAEAVVEETMAQIAPIEKFNPFEITFRVERAKLTAIISTLLQNFNVADISTAKWIWRTPLPIFSTRQRMLSRFHLYLKLSKPVSRLLFCHLIWLLNLIRPLFSFHYQPKFFPGFNGQ
jgi:ABC-2 type transport system ATP-binding protein